MLNSNLSQESLYRSRNEGTEINIFSLFATNTGKQTPCAPFVKAYASTETTNQVLFIEHNCHKWECKTCGPKLRYKWFDKQINHILDTPYLQYLLIDIEDWEKVKKRLQRSDAKYMKYKRLDNKALVICTEDIGGTEINKSYSTRKNFLLDSIAKTPLIRKPISQSQNWNAEENKHDSKKLALVKWKVLDSCNVGIKKIETTLTSMGYSPATYENNSQKGVSVILKNKDYFDILWKLGVHKRIKGEKRYSKAA